MRVSLGTLAHLVRGKKDFYKKMVFIKYLRIERKKVGVPVPRAKDASHHTLKQKYGRSRVA